MGVLVGLQLIEAWKPVLKGVVEFIFVATQVRMNLSEVYARAVVGEKLVRAQ